MVDNILLCIFQLRKEKAKRLRIPSGWCSYKERICRMFFIYRITDTKKGL